MIENGCLVYLNSNGGVYKQYRSVLSPIFLLTMSKNCKRYARNSSSTQGQIFELRPPDPLHTPSYYMQYIIPTIYVGNIHFWLSTFRFILYLSIFFLFLCWFETLFYTG